MSAVTLCPECLKIGVHCPDHPKTRMICVGFSKTRAPRQTASNRTWRKFLEMFVFPHEERPLFKLLNPKITDAQREAYWDNQEIERREREVKDEMQSRL